MNPLVQDEIDLENTSYRKLIEYEDGLLLRNELSFAYSIRVISGRVIVFAISVGVWLGTILGIDWCSNWLPEKNRPLLIYSAYIGSYILSLFISTSIWRAIGVLPRTVARTAIHYWPVTFYLVISIIYIFKK